MTDTTPATVPDDNLAPAIPGNDAQTDPSLITTRPVDSTPADGTPAESDTPDEETQPGNPSPADITNEAQPPAPADPDAAIYTEVVNEDGSRTLEILIGTSYFEIADAAEVTISAFELANQNGVDNSVMEVPAGATVTIPAPVLPVPTEPPLVDLDTATAQNVVQQNTIGSIQAQAVDAQAMIDPGFAAAAAGVAPIDIPGGLAPSSAAVPEQGIVGEVIEAPAGATIETGTAEDGNAEATIVAPAAPVDSAPVDLSALPAPTGEPALEPAPDDSSV
jgi:hypothetical protein